MSTVSKTPVGRPVAVPFTEQKKFIVNVAVFPLRDDKYPGKYVPADFFAEMIRKEIMKEAAGTIREAMILQCHSADITQPVLDMRAKVEVRLNVKGAAGFSALTHQQAGFLFTLRDEIVEIIKELKPPKSAWVLIGGKSKAPEPGVPNARPIPADKPAAAASGAGPAESVSVIPDAATDDRSPERRIRKHSKRRRTGSRSRKLARPTD